MWINEINHWIDLRLGESHALNATAVSQIEPVPL
jgi:hypothetical protein